ncbi:MAG: HEAT repeat domain-containing protein [Methanoregula sp.]|uniref:HEAT repeat domain-containing protein n=2 Tax=Methanoregula sp. TaxID=2052170 RepID=UPI003C5D904F
MSIFAFFRSRKPDIAAMAQKKDVPGLIRALRYHDADIQMQAAKALGTLGPGAIDRLIRALKTKNKTVKLGIIGALSEIESPRSIQPLIGTLRDENSEVRWQAAIALGEIGDEAAIKPLCEALRDPDKYVRFGASIALTKLGWKPQDSTERAYYFAGMQEWMAVRNIGKPAIPALAGLLRDRDSTVRMKVIELLGSTGDKDAIPALMQSLGDDNREVRWNTVLAAPKCGISLPYLPRGLSKRPQNMKNPWIAGFLNFLLPGTGYAYLGKWWGTLIFSFDELATVYILKMEGDTNSYVVLLPVYLLLGFHAWYMTTKIPKDPP